MHALAMILGLLASADPHRLRWSSASELTCPDRAVLEAALQARFEPSAVAPGLPSSDEVGLSVAATDDLIEITLREGAEGLLTRRTVPRSAGTCAELAQTVALLAEAWLVQLPWHGEGVVRAPVAVPATTTTASDAGPTPIADAGASAPPAPTPATPVAAYSVTPATTAEPPSRPRLWTFDIRASGGAFLYPGDGTFAGPEGGLAVELVLPSKLGFGVEASVDGDLTAADSNVNPPAPLVVHTQRFGAFASYRLQGWLELLTGAELVRLGETTSYQGGLGQNDDSTFVTGAGWVSAIGSLALYGPLRLFGQARLAVEPAEPFVAKDFGNSETLLTLSPVLLEIDAGLELRL